MMQVRVKAWGDAVYPAKRLKDMSPNEISIATDNVPVFEPEDIFVFVSTLAAPAYMTAGEVDILEEGDSNENRID